MKKLCVQVYITNKFSPGGVANSDGSQPRNIEITKQTTPIQQPVVINLAEPEISRPLAETIHPPTKVPIAIELAIAIAEIFAYEL